MTAELNTVEQTLQILMKNKKNHWIIKTMPIAATDRQQPYDLLVIALRRAGFDFFASNSKAREIINAN